ncbi:MAG: GNAT family N-acetyltransferase [Ignavibacteria bacterium]|nr:GNAT family N-acetyltransferase [Ignavibacteria bacterium]
MSNNNYIIRNASEKDLDFMIDLTAKEGWNPGLYDKKPFFAADPNGFFVGELGGEIISCVSGVKYENKFAFGGFYIVKEEYRGMDYGIQMYNHVIDYVNGLCFGIDGVVAQQENYKKSGFVFAHNQMRYEGIGMKGKLQTECMEIKNISMYDLVHFDKSIFKADRSSFLKEWIDMPESYGLAITDNSLVTGYGVIRKCFKGYKIGPIFAENKSIAEKLFLSLVEFAEGKEVYLDIPEINKDGMAIQEKYNMKYVFETARMYKNGNPGIPVEKVFGVTSFELG